MLVKSLKNGAWYCGYWLVQSETHVVDHVLPKHNKTASKGDTPAEAFEKWKRQNSYLNRFVEPSSPKAPARSSARS